MPRPANLLLRRQAKVVPMRKVKTEDAIEVPYAALTLQEAVYVLTNYFARGYFDAGKEAVVLSE
jgi:hypothetical protein